MPVGADLGACEGGHRAAVTITPGRKEICPSWLTAVTASATVPGTACYRAAGACAFTRRFRSGRSASGWHSCGPGGPGAGSSGIPRPESGTDSPWPRSRMAASVADGSRQQATGTRLPPPSAARCSQLPPHAARREICQRLARRPVSRNQPNPTGMIIHAVMAAALRREGNRRPSASAGPDWRRARNRRFK